MDKIIDISKYCGEHCYFYRNNPGVDEEGYINDNEECIIKCGGYDDTDHIYPSSCPGHGKYRMTLERVEDVPCPHCGHMNYGTSDDIVIKCENCLMYARFPEEEN